MSMENKKTRKVTIENGKKKVEEYEGFEPVIIV